MGEIVWFLDKNCLLNLLSRPHFVLGLALTHGSCFLEPSTNEQSRSCWLFAKHAYPDMAALLRSGKLKRNKARRLDGKHPMRSSKPRSRGNKNRNNNRPSGGSLINRVFDSSGPDGKVRGTPQQIIEKYNQLHRDSQLSGDRVNSENFAQHAEHYLRMLAEAQREVDAKRDEQEQQNRERQAERDRERTDRLKAQEAVVNDPAVIEQPEVPAELVETPEAKIEEQPQPEKKPRRPRQPRKPRAPKVVEGDQPLVVNAQPDAPAPESGTAPDSGTAPETAE